MLKWVVWFLLTAASCGGLTAWCLQQQYEEKSADFRILYREITVKLSQHDAIIPLLPQSQNVQEVQNILPQIVLWRRHTHLEPRRPIVAESNGRYWLNRPNVSLLIDLKTLLRTLPEPQHFGQLLLSWNGVTLYETGNASATFYWRWDKTIASPSQPLLLSGGDNPAWGTLPWGMIAAPALLWALVLYLAGLFLATKRRRDIADLRAHYAELTRLNTLGELAAGMVHELNQPLTAIMSYNQAAVRLLKPQNGETVSPLLDAAVVQIKRIDALLTQFRQRLANEQAEYQAVDVAALWLRVTRLLDNEIRQQKIRVSSRFATALPPLFAPPLWIEQILHNIVSNAIQAQRHNTPGSGWLHLAADADREGITLVVTDGGPGLSAEALEKLFMPFFTTREQGIGLGLALTDTLVQRLNGRIDASNIAGQGACFRLWFPLNGEYA